MAETARVNGLIGTLGLKAPVRAATTANIALTGEQTVDGVALVTGNRVLVKNQSTASENGIYYVETGAWTRAPDFDGARDVVTGTAVNVISGTVNALTQWYVSTTGDILPGTTALAFALSSTAFGADIAAITHAATLDRPLALHELPVWSSETLDLRKVTVESLLERFNIFHYLTDAEYTDVTTRAGLVDVRARIQALLDALEAAGGGVLYLPPGLYMIGAALVLPPKVFLIGAGSASTTIKLLAGADSNILQTKDFATLTGSNKWTVAEGVPTGFGFDGILFDGNKTAQTVAGGVAIYGKKYHIGLDVQIVETKGVGFYSECAYKGGEAVPEDQPEGKIGKIQVWNSDQEGIIYRGPHDQPIGDMFVALAGQAGTYDGVIIDGKVNFYNGATYITGSIHSYANTGRGVVLRTHVLANMLTGESCWGDGVVFESANANWIGSFYSSVQLAEAYNNDQAGTGTKWNIHVKGLGNTIGKVRVSNTKLAAGGVYTSGNNNTICGGVIVGNNTLSTNGVGYKNDGDYTQVALEVINYNQVGDVGFESATAVYCRYGITLFGCDGTSWLNSGVSQYNHYDVSGFAANGTGFTQTGSFGSQDTFNVKLTQPTGTTRLSHYRPAAASITNGNTSVTLTHNAFRTPTAAEIGITLTGDWRNAGAARSWWISSITATQFTITTDVAAPVGGLPFEWRLDMGG